MIKIHEYKLENHMGLNRYLARAMILEIYSRLQKSKYTGVNYDVIIKKNKDMGFSGILICKKTKHKYPFRYSYICNSFEINPRSRDS